MDLNLNCAVSSKVSILLRNNELVVLVFYCLTSAIDGFVEVAAATGEFATAITELSTSDVGEQLQQSLGVLANVERAAAEAQSTQSQQDMMTLMSTGMFSYLRSETNVSR